MSPVQRARFQGAVFYTNQKAADRPAWWSDICISYGDIKVSGLGTFGLPTVEIGTALVAALKAAGLNTEWDGNPNEKVTVRF